MAKIFPINVKRIITTIVSGGSANWLPAVTGGIAQQTKADLGRVLQSVGIGVGSAALTALTPQTVGVALANLFSGTVKPAQTAGVGTQTVGTGVFPEAAAAKIVQTTFNLTQTNGATGATSAGSWTNPTNAAGLHNATNATNANTLTAAASGALTMTYGAQASKTQLTISNVTLNGYWSNVAGLVGPCTYLIEYSVNGGTSWTTIQTGSAAVAAGTPTTATDITAAVGGSWSAAAAVLVRATYTGASSATASTLSVDAFELVVTASATQIQ